MRIDCPRFWGYEVVAETSTYEGRTVLHFTFTDPQTPTEVVRAFQFTMNDIMNNLMLQIDRTEQGKEREG